MKRFSIVSSVDNLLGRHRLVACVKVVCILKHKEKIPVITDIDMVEIENTLVATKSRSRMPRCSAHSPINASEEPS